jgi:hypothetical protein
MQVVDAEQVSTMFDEITIPNLCLRAESEVSPRTRLPEGSSVDRIRSPIP